MSVPFHARAGITVDDNIGKEVATLNARVSSALVKVEANPVIRGTLFEPELRAVSPTVEARYGFAEMKLVALSDLYAGKIAAALDRQHPRDLFDISYLLANRGVTDDIFQAFLIYLVSHKRPPHELLAPNLFDQATAYDGEFAGMTLHAVPLEELYDARARLIAEVRRRVREPRASAFVHSFYSLAPDWSS